MKKLKMFLIASLCAIILPFQAHSSLLMQSVTSAVDSVGKSAVRGAVQKVDANAKDIPTYISNRLNDTLVNTKEETANSSKVIASDTIKNGDDSRLIYKVEVDDNGIPKSVVAIVAIVFGTIFLCVITPMVFNFMLRRKKYKILEKAIDNNYKLPENAFGEGSLAARAGTVKGKADNANLMSGIKWSAWGIGLIIFFVMVGDEELSFIGVVLLIIGAGKLYIAYMNNKSYEQRNLEGENRNDDEPPMFNKNDK